MAKVMKDVLRVEGREEIHGTNPAVLVVMDADTKNAMSAMEEAQKSAVCAGDVAMMTVSPVMDEAMMIVTNVMDMGNCVWNVTDVMAMVN